MKQPETQVNNPERPPALAGAHGSATFDTEHRDNIVCPYCGYEDRDSWEVDFGPGLEGETEHQCADCGQTMKAERCCTVTYTTAKSPNNKSSQADQ